MFARSASGNRTGIEEPTHAEDEEIETGEEGGLQELPCPNCGARVPKAAVECPECGSPVAPGGG